MKKLFCVILAVAMLLCVPVSASAETASALSFGDDGEFVILHISDPQDDRYAAYDLINFVKLSIEETNPDLVILSGDIVEDSRVGDIGIDDMPSIFSDEPHHPLEQYLAVDAFEFRRSVWKMLADVPQGQCSEQCVAKCVNSYISVGVRDASYRALYLHASEPEGKAFRQCVHVISVTDS